MGSSGGPPGVVCLAGHAHDRDLYFDVLRPQVSGCRQTACEPGLPRDPVPARPPAARGSRAVSGLRRCPAYPSRTKDGDDVDFSTGSVGLGSRSPSSRRWRKTIFGSSSLCQTFRPAGRMIALAGDAELDEGNVFEALLEGWKHDVRNVWWIIDYNRQSLDCVVRGPALSAYRYLVPVDGLGRRDL